MKNENFFQKIGPGIVLAATGVGAGDMIAASVAGARYGIIIIWAVVAGAAIKFLLNEGIARWQLATGTSVVEGWRTKFPTALSLYFLIYLWLWGFIVGAALISACGLAAHAVFPSLSVKVWGIIQSLLALILVYLGRYSLVEKMMKFFIAVMFIVVCISAVLSHPDWGLTMKSLLLPTIPKGSAKFLLGIIGGVGGSVTLLCYGYWIREKEWIGRRYLSRARWDLVAAYLLTGLFGIAIIIIASGVKPEIITGSDMVIGLADQLGKSTGIWGKWIFLAGFWGAVFSSMLGVWQGVPYLFADFIQVYKRKDFSIAAKPIDTRSKNYLLFLFYLAVPPLSLLFFDKPVWIVIIYSITGAFFMPFLAALLFIMNSKVKWVKDSRNNLAINISLLIALVIFVLLCVTEILQMPV